MAVRAVVREWWDDEGWGVVESPETPGGCWAHCSAVAVAGYRTLQPGQEVSLEWEAAAQDGFDHRAVRLWPAGEAPATPTIDGSNGGAYWSTLTVTFDADGRGPADG